MEDILYVNSATDVRVKEMVETIPSKDKELPNLIILTILSVGAGLVTPIFSKDASGTTVFSSIDEIGTKFILDEKEVTSDDFLVVTKSQYGANYNFFGLLFEDSNEHTLKISLVSSAIPSRFQKITTGLGCSANSITHILISNSITLIGNNAFQDCNSLLSVTIPNSVTSIGDYAFYGCSGLTSLTIPNSVTSIGYEAFIDCTGLTSVTIPNSVIEIGDEAFSGCSGLTSVTIGNSVTSIGADAFSGCSGLTSVTIPNSVTSIGGNAFFGCSGLTSMVVEDGNTKYDSRNNCNAIIETATNTLISGCKNTIIPNSVTSIGDCAFVFCSGLTSVAIPNSVTRIGDYAFFDCTGLTSVTIGNSVIEIGDEAFSGCSGLTQVTIPNSVTSIGNSAFSGCSGLISITSLATTAPAILSGTFYNIKTNGTLHVPAGSDYSAWMATSDYYLGKYNWTKVEDA